jgi:hypothetical protein
LLPSYEFQCDQNARRKSFFKNKTNFLSISKTLAFWFGQEKLDNQEKPAQFQSH